MRPGIINFFSFNVSRRSPKHLWCQHLYKKKLKKKILFTVLCYSSIHSFCLSIHPFTDCAFERECCFWLQTHTARWICQYPPAYNLVKVPYFRLLFSHPLPLCLSTDNDATVACESKTLVFFFCSE